jgi:predicted anti-sigma-YlaC factor YlaD
MSAIGTSVVCQRVRAQVSLQLDDELSELERRMLSAHLERCPACSAYAADLTAFTHELRSAPLELLERPIVVRRPRRLALARLQVGVAAALAIATVGLATQIIQSGRGDTSLSRPTGTVTRFPTRAELDRELAILESLPTRATVSPRSSLL